MNTLISYTTRLESVLSKSRDGAGKPDVARLSEKDRVKVALILCDAFTYVIESGLVPRLFEDIRSLYAEHRDEYKLKDVDDMLIFFESFLAFEARLFELNNIPRVVANDTFNSVTDIHDAIRSFMTDQEFRERLLNADELTTQLQRQKEIVCDAGNREATEVLVEKRFILGGLAAAGINTALDIGTGMICLFALFSAGAGAFVAWRRANW